MNYCSHHHDYTVKYLKLFHLLLKITLVKYIYDFVVETTFYCYNLTFTFSKL